MVTFKLTGGLVHLLLPLLPNLHRLDNFVAWL